MPRPAAALLVAAAVALAATLRTEAREPAKPAPEASKAPAPSSPPAPPAPAPAAVPKATPTSKAKADPKLSAEEFGARPYKIRAWVAIDPRARIDARGREALVSSWLAMARRFVGPPWEIEVAEGPGPLLGGEVDGVQADAVEAAAKGVDKAWLLAIGPDGKDGYVLAGREFDVATLRLNPTLRHLAPHPADAPRVMLKLALGLFSPVAEIGEQVGGGVKIIVQGAGLQTGDSIGRVVAKDSTFRVVRVSYAPDGTIARRKDGTPIIKDVPHAFLRVEAMDGPVARCGIVSGVKNPLTKAARSSRVIALGIKPANNPTRFHFVVPPEKKRDPADKSEPAPPKPAAGYVLTVRNIPDGSPREVGITDREGRVVLPAGFSDRLVVVRLLAGSSEPLVEFPVMPGETAGEQTVPISPKPEAVALESALSALRDELIDLVGVRARMLSRIDARVKAANWDEAKTLIAQFHKLPARKDFEERIAKMRQKAVDDQRELKLKRPILTKTAQAQLADAEGLLDHFLKEDQILALEETVKSQGATGAPPPKPAIPGPAVPAPGAMPPTATAPAVVPPPPPPPPPAG